MTCFRFLATIWLPLLMLVIGVAGQTFEERLKIIRNVLDVTYSTSHLPQVATSNDLPYPHSETYLSLQENQPRPCRHAREERYRRADGVCNNLLQPFQGAALDTQLRLFTNTFMDGLGFPHVQDRDFHDLPNAREVSLRCFDSEEDVDGNGNNRLATQMVWQFGQILAHDITHVEKVDGSNECCDQFNRDSPNEALYDSNRNHCMPIAVPRNDPHFNHSCIPFSRSYAVNVFGVKEPINAVTSYIDASTVYGSSVYLQKQLREGIQGLMKTSHSKGGDQLPTFGDFPCTKSAHVHQCPVGGDIRVSDQPGLGSIHTMFHLEHNRIARHLFKLASHWNDEALFQETRKIIIGILQKIVYEDFLPLLVGDDVMRIFNLNGDYVYDSSVNGVAILDFTTTGLRFGHTLINTVVGGFHLRDIFLEPVTNDYLDYHMFPFYQSNHTAHEFNNRFTNELRHHLFEGVQVEGFDAHPGPSFDLMALNIQRGRDHGIAPYTAVRDVCLKLLSAAAGVEKQLPACFAEGVYRKEEDIDLFTGGVSERPLPDAILGQTFACMAGIQFQKLKFGDRFFYQGKGLEGFTDAQLAFIRQNTLASLICELNPKSYLQRDVFRPASDSNPRIPCQTILFERNLQEGLNAWLDKPKDFEIRQNFI